MESTSIRLEGWRKQTGLISSPFGTKSMALCHHSSCQLAIYFSPCGLWLKRGEGNSFLLLLFCVPPHPLFNPKPAHTSESRLFVKSIYLNHLYLNSFFYQLRIFSNLKYISYEKLVKTCKGVTYFPDGKSFEYLRWNDIKWMNRISEDVFKRMWYYIN